MFTGIIREIGVVESCAGRKGLVRLEIHAPQTAPRVEPSESIAINGVCLTVVSVRYSVMVFEMIPETQKLTSLGGLRQGSLVNVEASLRLMDRLNGHVVLGHVDGLGIIARQKSLPGELILTIRVAKDLRRYLVPKGPITVDGVSLTVGRHLTRDTFTIHLIPETLKRTTLHTRGTGDKVNLEIDYLAKLTYQFLRA